MCDFKGSGAGNSTENNFLKKEEEGRVGARNLERKPAASDDGSDAVEAGERPTDRLTV